MVMAEMQQPMSRGRLNWGGRKHSLLSGRVEHWVVVKVSYRLGVGEHFQYIDCTRVEPGMT